MSSVKNLIGDLEIDQEDLKNLNEREQFLYSILFKNFLTAMSTKMTEFERDFTKRHNQRMMNEMQEVVRLIQTTAKANHVHSASEKDHKDLLHRVQDVQEKTSQLYRSFEELLRQLETMKLTTQQKMDLMSSDNRQALGAVTMSVRTDLRSILTEVEKRLNKNQEDLDRLTADVSKLQGVETETPNDLENDEIEEKDFENDENFEEDEAMESKIQKLSRLLSKQPNSNSSSANQVLAILSSASKCQGNSVEQQMATLQKIMANLPKQQQLNLQLLIQQAQANKQQNANNLNNLQSIKGATSPQVQQITSNVIKKGNLTLTKVNSQTNPSQQNGSAEEQQQSTLKNLKFREVDVATINCPFFATFAWCRFGQECKYKHLSTGNEPLKHLPHNTINTLQQQLSGPIQNIPQLAATGAFQSALQQLVARAGYLTSNPHINNVSLKMESGEEPLVQWQVTMQNEASKMGAEKAKLIHCKYFSIGHCIYGENCLYLHIGNKMQNLQNNNYDKEKKMRRENEQNPFTITKSNLSSGGVVVSHLDDEIAMENADVISPPGLLPPPGL